MTCPKCQRERRPGDDSCGRCGLLITRWEGFAHVEPTHEALEQPWIELQTAWSDPSAHVRFLELAAMVDGLDVAAARYRRVSLERPDDEVAQTGLRQSVERAHTLYVTRARLERPPRAPAILKLVGTMCAGLIMIVALWTLFHILYR